MNCLCLFVVANLNLLRDLIFVFLLVLSTLQALFKRGNQVASKGRSTYTVVVPFPRGLFTLYLLDSLYAGPQFTYVPVQLGPVWDHVLSAVNLPDEVQGVLRLYRSSGASRQGPSPIASEMCEHVISLRRYVEVRTITELWAGRYFVPQVKT